MIKPTIEEIHEFLRESNAIEREYDEESFDDSIRAWNFLMNRTEMNPFLVMQVHELLMDTRPLERKYKGQLRDIPVYIGGKEAMKSNLIPAALEEWCLDMNDNAGPDEEHSKWLHVKYEAIHPFVDGNGRTGRLFMNWWRLRNNLPILIIHEGEEQMEYYKWFREK